MWIFKPGILISALSVAFLSASSEQILKKDEVLICVRWQWSGHPYEGRVICKEWVKKDCSQRLYKEICKLGS
jgi:hypothetical protein